MPCSYLLLSDALAWAVTLTSIAILTSRLLIDAGEPMTDRTVLVKLVTELVLRMESSIVNLLLATSVISAMLSSRRRLVMRDIISLVVVRAKLLTTDFRLLTLMDSKEFVRLVPVVTDLLSLVRSAS